MFIHSVHYIEVNSGYVYAMASDDIKLLTYNKVIYFLTFPQRKKLSININNNRKLSH